MKRAPDKTVISTTVTRRWEICDESIEEMIRDRLGIPVDAEIDFDWDIRQGGLLKGVIVTHKSISTEVK